MNREPWNRPDDWRQDTNDQVTSSSDDALYTYRVADSQPTATAPARNKGNKGRTATVVAAALLCLLLCFGAGAAGSLLMARYINATDPSLVPSQDTHPQADADKEGGASSNTPADPSREPTDPTVPLNAENRNPAPSIQKQPSLGEVDYNGSAGDGAYGTLTQAIAAVSDSVVEIFTETMVSGGWLGNYITEGAGSGVIISEDGYIVTNHHVISNAVTVTVRMTDGTTYEAQIVGADEASDIAVLWVDADQALPAASLGCSADLIVGEQVFAIGNPLGSLGGTVTDGIISATAREITVGGVSMTLLQTNAAVNPGNSGGGLFNMAGELIGVVNAKCSQEDVEGLGFAIPIDHAYEVIEQLIAYGYVRGVVDAGLDLYNVSTSNIMVALRYFGMRHAGVYVLESKYSSEIKYGDLLLTVDGSRIATTDDVENALASHSVGDTVTLTLLRAEPVLQNGRETSVEKEITVELTLQEYVPEGAGIQFEAD